MAIRATAEHLLDRLVTQRDGIAIGQPMTYSATRDQAFTTGPAILTVPRGQVFVLTQIVAQAELHTAVTTTPDEIASPNQAGLGFGIQVLDTAGAAKWNAKFMTFIRWQGTFEFQNSPNWRNAPADNVYNWKPRYGLAIPGGWTVNTTQNSGSLGNACAVYGVMMSPENARTLGYSATATNTLADLNSGFVSAVTTASSAVLVPSKAGKHIRILDIAIQVQPETNTSNVLTIEQYDGSTATTIFQFSNRNPSDQLKRSFSPDIYLKLNSSIRIKSTVANTAFVTVSYEYVEPREVPGDHWWCFTIPDYPTPALPGVGTVSDAVAQSTTVTAYYPKDGTTKTSPTQGYQHLLNGYAISVQKDTSVVPEQLFLSIMTHSTTAAIGSTLLGVTGAGNALTATYAAAGHDQNVCDVADHLMLPAKPHTGSIYIATMNVGVGGAYPVLGVPATPTSGTAQIDSWGVTTWGRTIPAKFTEPINLGS